MPGGRLEALNAAEVVGSEPLALTVGLTSWQALAGHARIVPVCPEGLDAGLGRRPGMSPAPPATRGIFACGREMAPDADWRLSLQQLLASAPGRLAANECELRQREQDCGQY